MKHHSVPEGTKVLISQDCRPGGPATGKIGTYEGDFPLTVVFGYQPTPKHETDWKDGEYPYEDYRSGFIKMQNGQPANQIYLEWEPGKECPLPFFAMPMTNPRIRLEDGSVIWGCECWWGPVVDGLTLEKAQEQTENTKIALAALIEALQEKKND